MTRDEPPRPAAWIALALETLRYLEDKDCVKRHAGVITSIAELVRSAPRTIRNCGGHNCEACYKRYVKYAVWGRGTELRLMCDTCVERRELESTYEVVDVSEGVN